MPVLTRTIRARSTMPGMLLTLHHRVAPGVYKPARPLRVLAVYDFVDRQGTPTITMVFDAGDMWPLPWCSDFGPGSLVEIVAPARAVRR